MTSKTQKITEVMKSETSPQASPEPRAPTVSMQTLSDAGLNPFAVELLHESFSRKKDYAQWTGPNSFVFNGMRMTLEKQQHFESRVTASVGQTLLDEVWQTLSDVCEFHDDPEYHLDVPAIRELMAKVWAAK